jgi:heme/copper-type cytochrome/quinol oxidase subunit 3
MNTALEQMHEIEPHIRIGRARAGVLMLIVSDALSVVAILAAGGYLSALNVAGQYKGGDPAPAFLPGLLAVIVLVLSGLVYYLWERGVRRVGGAGQRALFIISWALILIALAAQIWVSVGLKYASPFHAYASMLLLLAWYSAFHLLLAAIIGLLVLGRILNGRLVDRGYIVEVVGYWWYYTVIAGLLMWLFSLVA